MSTKIFKSFSDFLNRENNEENGVSETFAKNNPNWEKDNGDNEGCWDCSHCSDCSDCSGCSDCSRCSRCSRCSDCSGCSDCSDCSGCSGCSRCSRCSGCSRCSDCSDCSNISYMDGVKNEKPSTVSEAGFIVPVIKDIHQKVLDAIEGKPEAFDMSGWHNTQASCGTTHCRAGWVVHLAGEAGYKLEAKTNTAFAAMQIYHASNPAVPVSPPRFYETNEIALADIKRCAEEEKSLTAKA